MTREGYVLVSDPACDTRSLAPGIPGNLRRWYPVHRAKSATPLYVLCSLTVVGAEVFWRLHLTKLPHHPPIAQKWPTRCAPFGVTPPVSRGSRRPADGARRSPRQARVGSSTGARATSTASCPTAREPPPT
eukprot:1177088-Prorocentrum_minimum.AAC.3